MPTAAAGALHVEGLVFGGQVGGITIDASGEVTASTLPIVVG